MMEAEIKELGEVCSFQRGLTYAKGDEVDVSSIVVLRANNISLDTNALDFTELKYLKDSVSVPENKLIRRDSLMICTASGSKAHLGKVAYIDDDYGYAFGGFMGLLVPDRKVFARYLYYMMLTEQYKEFIGALSDGVNINNLKWDDLRSFTFPLPPLPEQQRIVTKLDAAFAALAEAQANVERNLANARELFESYLNGVFEGKDWKLRKLDDVCGFQNGFAFKSNTFKAEGVPVLRISNIQDGIVDLRRLVYVDPNDYREDLDRYKIVEDDLVIAMSGATTGKVGFNKGGETFYLNQRVGKFEPTKDLSKRYLYYFLSTKVDENLSISAGSAQPNLSTEQIKNFQLPLPPIEVQGRIVSQLDGLMVSVQELEGTYQQKLAELEGLKKALLGAAFNRKL